MLGMGSDRHFSFEPLPGGGVTELGTHEQGLVGGG